MANKKFAEPADASRKARAKIHAKVLALRKSFAKESVSMGREEGLSPRQSRAMTKKWPLADPQGLRPRIKGMRVTKGAVASSQAHMSMRGAKVRKMAGGGSGSRSAAARKAWITRKRGK